MQHKEYIYEKGFKGKQQFYFVDSYSGKIRIAKRPITDKSYFWIGIGQWQNKLHNKKYDYAVKIVYGDTTIRMTETFFHEVSKALKEFRKNKG